MTPPVPKCKCWWTSQSWQWCWKMLNQTSGWRWVCTEGAYPRDLVSVSLRCSVVLWGLFSFFSCYLLCSHLTLCLVMSVCNCLLLAVLHNTCLVRSSSFESCLFNNGLGNTDLQHLGAEAQNSWVMPSNWGSFWIEMWWLFVYSHSNHSLAKAYPEQKWSCLSFC